MLKENKMKRISWLKLSTGIFDDEKIILLLSMKNGPEMVIFFLRLLTMSAKQNQSGMVSLLANVPYSVNDLAIICQLSPKKCEDYLKVLEQFHIIFTEFPQNSDKKIEKNNKSKFIFITNWEQHQSVDKLDKIRQQQNERAKRYRAKQTCNAIVTLPIRHSNAIEEEVELEVELEKEEKNIKKEDLFKFLIDPLIGNFQTFKNPEPKSKTKDPKSLKKAESKKLLDSATTVETVDKTKKKVSQFTPKVKEVLQYLNQPFQNQPNQPP